MSITIIEQQALRYGINSQVGVYSATVIWLGAINKPSPNLNGMCLHSLVVILLVLH